MAVTAAKSVMAFRVLTMAVNLSRLTTGTMNVNAGHEITSKARIIHQIQLIRGITHIPYEDYDSKEKLDVGMTNESLSLLKSCGDFVHTDFKDTAYTSFITIKEKYIKCSDIGCYPLFYRLEKMKIPDGNFVIARDPIRETVFFQQLYLFLTSK
ncbi:hypothetical protein LD112_25670 [Pantoea agglomerans]|nr:hypothetical protein [Pantoea agglomerans]